MICDICHNNKKGSRKRLPVEPETLCILHRCEFIQAMPGTILVDPEFEPTISKSGLLLRPRKLEAKPSTGYIVAVGDGVADLEVGDYVGFADANPIGFHRFGHNFIPLKLEQVAVKIT